MNAEARQIDEVLWRDLMQCRREMLNPAASQGHTPELERDDDATPCGAD